MYRRFVLVVEAPRRPPSRTRAMELYSTKFAGERTDSIMQDRVCSIDTVRQIDGLWLAHDIVERVSSVWKIQISFSLFFCAHTRTHIYFLCVRNILFGGKNAGHLIASFFRTMFGVTCLMVEEGYDSRDKSLDDPSLTGRPLTLYIVTDRKCSITAAKPRGAITAGDLLFFGRKFLSA